LRKWSLVEFKNLFTNKLSNQIQEVYFCGTYGDPLTHNKIVEMCQYLKQQNKTIKIGIHTNGGIGKTQWYCDLVEYTDFIAFGIDGLEDTNHLYRRNVKWNQVLENAQAYIQTGGFAIWDYVVFEHNEHQVEDARQLSKQLGFKEFNIKKTSRFFKRNHEYNTSLNVYNKHGEIDYTISVPKNKEYLNQGYQVINKLENITDYSKSTTIKCNACQIGEIYIGADGFVFPCGWLHDRMYGPESELHMDYLLIKKLIDKAGGYKNTNIFYSSLTQIINGPWFDVIEQSWSNADRLERCGIMCGSKVNLIKDQNTYITYKK
jgi:MoaA/NifB/PqqE/SkfB family radical SAM enzyme